jgi:hypothetical protein
LRRRRSARPQQPTNPGPGGLLESGEDYRQGSGPCHLSKSDRWRTSTNCLGDYCCGATSCRQLGSQIRWPPREICWGNLTGQGYFCARTDLCSKLGELFVSPMPPVVAAPDFSVDEPACDGSTREDHRPQVPCLCPGGLRAKVHHRAIIVINDHRTPLRKNKAAERNIIARRLRCARSGWGAIIRCRYAYYGGRSQRNSFVKLNTGAAG